MHQIILPMRALPRAAAPRITCLARPSTAPAFSTTATRAATCSRQFVLSQQPQRAAQPHCSSIRDLCQRPRQALSQRRSVSAVASPPSASPNTTTESLTWNRFLALRKQRRRISLVASILCAGAGAAIGITVLSTSDFDVMQFGIDPTFVIGGAFIGSALLGWLAGPAFGNAAFNLRYRAIRAQIARVSRLDFYHLPFRLFEY